MNSSSPDDHGTCKKRENKQVMRFGRRQVPSWSVYAVLGAFAAFVLLAASFAMNSSYQEREPQPLPPIQGLEKPVQGLKQHRATDFLINRLKKYGLWEIPSSQEIPRFFIDSYPPDLNNVKNIAVRKRVFLNALLPHALFVRQEALERRSRLQSILKKIDCSPEDINFTTALDHESQCSWADYLAEDDRSFIENLCRKYRTTSAEVLLERVDAVPTSIILAQGALESSWGSSRFTREGNSVFGMLTWKNNGIIPARRDEGKTHKVMIYDNIRDAVRGYQLTLNRLDPYEEFRQLRRQTDDPLVLAEGLTLYSERGEAYVEDIKNVILSNDLLKYDDCSLSDLDLSKFSEAQTKPAPDDHPGKTAL
ncbi:MAG: glucosaminidase domain-containing protein [Desulfobulbales bacterium]